MVGWRGIVGNGQEASIIRTELGGNGDRYFIHFIISSAYFDGGTKIYVSIDIMPHVLPILIAVSLLSPVRI
jgi:hypothetical protein